MWKFNYFLLISCFILKVLAVPPSKCRAEFRWEDCGKPPKAVMYYWKSGSRCEIGIWKGCLPNPNMFADEYDCINTCVFADRPEPPTETTNLETYTPSENAITDATVDNIDTIIISTITVDSDTNNDANATQESNTEENTTTTTTTT